MTDDEKLARYAHGNGNRWWFDDPELTHDRASTLAIIDACLMLEVPVTDTLTSAAWLRLITRVAQLERQVEGR